MHRMKKSTQIKTGKVIQSHEEHVINYKRSYLKQKKALEVS